MSPVITEEQADRRCRIRSSAIPTCLARCSCLAVGRGLQAGKEIFAYVLNMAATGDHYWVHAHVTPTFDSERPDHQLSFQSARSRSRRDRNRRPDLSAN